MDHTTTRRTLRELLPGTPIQDRLYWMELARQNGHHVLYDVNRNLKYTGDDNWTINVYDDLA